MSKYSKEFVIPYYDTDKNGYVFPTSLLTYMGETSSYHSDYLGVGLEVLRKNNYGWMLHRWKVKFNRYPKVREKLLVKTWTSGFDKFYATREFKIYDEENNEIVKATTLWIFLDIVKKRPRRIPKELYTTYRIMDEKLLHDYFIFEGNIEHQISLDFHVRKSDIDYNNHVNNVKYLNWMLEVIPNHIDRDYILTELDIQYKKEIKLGDLIISSIDKGTCTNDTIEFLHTIKEENSSDINAFGRTVWKKI